MNSKVELVRLVLKDVLRVQVTKAEAEKVLSRIEALHEKDAVELKRALDVCPECDGKGFVGSWMPRPCDACDETGKRK